MTKTFKAMQVTAPGTLEPVERGVIGSITGSPFENEKTLAFSLLTGARPMIKTMPLEKAAQAYRKMKSGDVRFRMVLTMKGDVDAHQ